MAEQEVEEAEAVLDGLLDVEDWSVWWGKSNPDGSKMCCGAPMPDPWMKHRITFQCSLQSHHAGFHRAYIGHVCAPGRLVYAWK